MARSPALFPSRPALRARVLAARQRLKMARSAHAYVRGSTANFYEWLDTAAGRSVPEGPAIWICGDCHVGNLGPVSHADGRVAIQIRDLDQTVIGNPAHDLIRLALSLATAARGSDLPGLATVHMLEQMMIGYEAALRHVRTKESQEERPAAVRVALGRSLRNSWKRLLKDRLEDTSPVIPRGARFWPLTKVERGAIGVLFESDDVRKLVNSLECRDDDAPVKVLDAAYWMKGCSSLGRLRHAVLVRSGHASVDKGRLCLMDIKEASAPCAPRLKNAVMPKHDGERVVTGARSLSPYLGQRMLSAKLLGKSVFLRELLPQDLKLEVESLTLEEASLASRFLAGVVGTAHARQLDAKTRRAWRTELGRRRSKTIDAPSWLWRSVVDLMGNHEVAYLEHCRRYATSGAK